MLNNRPKIFDNYLPAHHPLILTQGCGIDQVIMILEYVYFTAKNNSLGLLKAFHYCDKFLLSCIVVTLWIAQSSS